MNKSDKIKTFILLCLSVCVTFILVVTICSDIHGNSTVSDYRELAENIIVKGDDYAAMNYETLSVQEHVDYNHDMIINYLISGLRDNVISAGSVIIMANCDAVTHTPQPGGTDVISITLDSDSLAEVFGDSFTGTNQLHAYAASPESSSYEPLYTMYQAHSVTIRLSSPDQIFILDCRRESQTLPGTQTSGATTVPATTGYQPVIPYIQPVIPYIQPVIPYTQPVTTAPDVLPSKDEADGNTNDESAPIMGEMAFYKNRGLY